MLHFGNHTLQEHLLTKAKRLTIYHQKLKVRGNSLNINKKKHLLTRHQFHIAFYKKNQTKILNLQPKKPTNITSDEMKQAIYVTIHV